MHASRRYLEIDVFSRHAFLGNPLAVIVDSEGLDTVTMQRIAAWINFSETTFLLPPIQPEADYRIRIFTPRTELPFAGHPSVGSAYAAIESGVVEMGKKHLIQECEAGLLPVHVDGADSSRVIRVQAPPARIDPIGDAERKRLTAALGIAPAQAPLLVDNGPGWIVCNLGEGQSVRSLHPQMKALNDLTEVMNAVGVSVFGHERGEGAAMAVRAFVPGDGVPEDPVTGSANAAIAAYLKHTSQVDTYGHRYRVSQGREVGRDGFVDVEIADNGTISIGGSCNVVVTGRIATG